MLYTSGSTGKPKGVLHSTADTCCMQLQHLNIALTIRRETFIGVQQTLAGSLATVMSPTGQCSMQPLAYYLRGHPFIQTIPDAGKSSRSTVSQNSTPHQRQSDHSWLLGMTRLQDMISPVSKFWE